MRTESNTISDLKYSLLKDLENIFQGGEAYSITRIILEHNGYPEISILKNPSQIIDTKLQLEIKKIVSELNKNKPIQYILGETVFFDLRFFVDENVLIPRPETEELVSKILLENKKINPKILDIGSGSGCISISLAHSIPLSEVSALDVDARALSMAKRNALENKVSIQFYNKSIFDQDCLPENSIFDLIISNPPYVTEAEKEYMLPNVIKYEPEIALFVPDNDPLVFYREIINFSRSRLAKGGSIWVEINEKFGPELVEMFRKEGYKTVRLLKDIHDRNRFIKATNKDV